MWAIGLAICLTIILSQLLSVWLLQRAARRSWDQLSEQARSFIQSPGEGQASPLALLWQMMARSLGSEVAQSLKASLMGSSSSIAKAETALQADMMMDGIEAKSPMLGLLLQSFPRVAKRLAKSPAAMAALGNLDLRSILSGISGGGNGAHAPGPGGAPASWDM